MHETIGIPACFSTGERSMADEVVAVTKAGQSMYMSMYQTKIAGKCRLTTVTWCKNLALHGLSVSVGQAVKGTGCCCKVELKPWCFWRKQGSKHFEVDGRTVGVFWDLKAAKFHGETEAQSDYYVAIVCEDEVVLLLGDLKKDAYRRTGCRPALIEPILVSRREHVFGRKKFSTRIKFHEKGRAHEISIGCSSIGNRSSSGSEFDPELEIRVDGHLTLHVKHLQWKFRGNQCIHVNRTRVEVFWDAHDWLFGTGPRHALFIFSPVLSPPSSAISSISSSSSPGEDHIADGSNKFCLFFYAWKVD